MLESFKISYEKDNEGSSYLTEIESYIVIDCR